LRRSISESLGGFDVGRHGEHLRSSVALIRDAADAIAASSRDEVETVAPSCASAWATA
jgi:hypothetical protein